MQGKKIQTPQTHAYALNTSPSNAVSCSDDETLVDDASTTERAVASRGNQTNLPPKNTGNMGCKP